MMKRSRFLKIALLLAVPLALYSYVSYVNSWRPKTIELPRVRPINLNFSPDGRYLLVTNWREVTADTVICDVAQRRAVHTIKNAGNAHFLDNGTRISVFSGSMNYSRSMNSADHFQTQIFSFPDCKIITAFWNEGLKAENNFLATWPDQKTVAARDNKGNIFLWNTQSNRLKKVSFPLAALKAPWVYEVKFLPDNKTVYIGKTDTRDGHMWCQEQKFWDWQTKKPIFSINTGEHRFLSASENGFCALRTKNDNIEIWNYRQGKKQCTLPNKDFTVVLSPNGLLVATINGYSGSGNSQQINLWDAKNGKKLRVLEGGQDGFNPLIFSPDNCTLAAGNRNGFVQLWRVK